MFYRPVFFGVLICNACFSVIFFALALALGPVLSQTLGAVVSSMLFVFATLLIRARTATHFAAEMWQRSAPPRRIAFNVLVPAFLGHFVIYLPLSAIGALSTSSFVLFGLTADSALVILASCAGMLMGRNPAEVSQ